MTRTDVHHHHIPPAYLQGSFIVHLKWIEDKRPVARTAVDLIITNTIRKYNNCKVILSHGGGTFPYLARRPDIMLKDLGLSDITPGHFLENAHVLYFDLALTKSLFALPLSQKFAPPDHILFGSDFQYAPEATVRLFTKGLDEVKPEADLEGHDINRGDSLKPFPRLQ